MPAGLLAFNVLLSFSIYIFSLLAAQMNKNKKVKNKGYRLKFRRFLFDLRNLK
jgi:hypothetical protein